MLESIALLCLLIALGLLIALALIDLKTCLLPNELVFGFLIAGFVFHLTTLFMFVPPEDMILGGITGFGILYMIRAGANYFYGEDALGLGDVKLLGAAGVWLGPYHVFMALSLGALFGVIHGLWLGIYIWAKSGVRPNFQHLSLPAGPGFILGIVLTAFVVFNELPRLLPL